MENNIKLPSSIISKIISFIDYEATLNKIIFLHPNIILSCLKYGSENLKLHIKNEFSLIVEAIKFAKYHGFNYGYVTRNKLYVTVKNNLEQIEHWNVQFNDFCTVPNFYRVNHVKEKICYERIYECFGYKTFSTDDNCLYGISYRAAKTGKPYEINFDVDPRFKYLEPKPYFNNNTIIF